MQLVSLIYVSKFIPGESSENPIAQILNSSRENNKKLNLTGMLCFNRNYFLQCLEGSRKNVNDLFFKILKDNRHSEIMILDYQELIHRNYEKWSMGYVSEIEKINKIVLKYSRTDEFNPYEFTGDTAFHFLLELSESLSEGN